MDGPLDLDVTAVPRVAARLEVAEQPAPVLLRVRTRVAYIYRVSHEPAD
jgi:hypothetical protein